MPNTFTSDVSFSYLRKGSGLKKLGLGSSSHNAVKVPDEESSLPTIRGVIDSGVEGLTQDIKLLVLSLPNAEFSTKFTVGYVPQGEIIGTPVGIMPTWIGELDILGLDAPAVIGKVRDLVNAKLGGV